MIMPRKKAGSHKDNKDSIPLVENILPWLELQDRTTWMSLNTLLADEKNKIPSYASAVQRAIAKLPREKRIVHLLLKEAHGVAGFIQSPAGGVHDHDAQSKELETVGSWFSLAYYALICAEMGVVQLDVLFELWEPLFTPELKPPLVNIEKMKVRVYEVPGYSLYTTSHAG